jgi:hypothetical protein
VDKDTESEALRAVMEKLGELMTSVESMNKELKEVKGNVAMVDKAVRGHNSNPGLLTRIALLEHNMKEVKDEQTKAETRKDRAYWYMVTTIIATIISVALFLLGLLLR